MAVWLQLQRREIGFLGIIDDDADVHRRRFNVSNRKCDLTDEIVAGRHAVDRNQLARFSGKVTLFRADHWTGNRQTGATSDWEYLARGGVDVLSYPCTHGEIISQKWLAEWIGPLKRAITQDSGADGKENYNIPSRHPGNWIASFKRVFTRLSGGAPSEEVPTHYSTQVDRVPEAAWVAFARSKQGDLAGEIQNYEIARTERLDIPEWISINLAAAYVQQADLVSAIKVLRHAARASPKAANCHFELARLLLRQGRHAKLRQLAKTVDLLPAETASDFQLRGSFFNFCNMLRLSEEAYRQALLLDPLRTECYNLCARMLSENGRLDEAIKLINAGVEARPHMLFMRELLAQLYMKTGDDEKAELISRAVLAQERTRPRSVILLCTLLRGQGKTAEALELAVEANDRNPGHLGLLNIIAELHLVSGQLDLARTGFKKSIELRDELLPSRLGLSRVLEAMGHPHEAIASLRNVPASLRQSDELKRRVGEILQSLEESDTTDHF